MNITQKIFRFIVFLIFSSNMSVLIMAMHRNALIPEHYTASKTLGDKKVLLVDDNKMNLKIGSRHLKKIGVSFETAESGSLAIAKASVCLFHIILMDIQ